MAKWSAEADFDETVYIGMGQLCRCLMVVAVSRDFGVCGQSLMFSIRRGRCGIKAISFLI